MTVKKLKQLLETAPENMKVYVMMPAEGVFCFAEACEGETGITELGPEPGPIYDKDNPGDSTEEGVGLTVFAVLPHGFGVPEGEEPPVHIHN